MSDEMELIPLIAGMSAKDLWPLVNLCLPAWLLLVAFPRWKWTPTLTLIPPLIHATIYAWSAITIMAASDDQPDFLTLEGVVGMFADPNVVFIGWVHYIVVDLLVGRAISIDAIERGASNMFYALVIAPCLLVTLMACPIGFLLYAMIRTIALPSTLKEKTA